MFKIMKSKKKTYDGETLDKVSNLLFPPPQVREEDGQKMHIDYSIDYNLMGVLADLEEGHNDETVHRTISFAIGKLAEVRRILEPKDDVDPDVKYFVVDIEDERTKDPFENIKVDDDR